MNDMNCTNCVFSKKGFQMYGKQDMEVLACIYNPPTIILIQDELSTVFPHVNETICCAQYLKQFEGENDAKNN